VVRDIEVREPVGGGHKGKRLQGEGEVQATVLPAIVGMKVTTIRLGTDRKEEYISWVGGLWKESGV